MNSVVLIPWPQTTWSAAERIASRTPVPLDETGQTRARAWADEMANSGLNMLFSSGEQASVETAGIIAERCRAQRKTLSELAEVDAGLWDGLTVEELRRRDPKIYKRWRDDPSSICPPEGEGLNEAFQRLQGAFNRIARKPDGRPLGVVLGPLAFALVRCVVESVEPARVRSMMHDEPLRYQLVG